MVNSDYSKINPFQLDGRTWYGQKDANIKVGLFVIGKQ